MKQKIILSLLFIFPLFLHSQEKEFQVFFDFDISETNTASSKKLSKWIQENPSAEVVKIYGYCDAVGSIEYNDYLSLKRAEYIVEILKNNTIKVGENATVKGFGEQFAQSPLQSENRKAVVFYTIPEKAKPEIIKGESNLSKEIKTLKVGDKLKLKNLNFYNRSGIIVPDSKPTLNELLNVLVEKPNLKIEIQGHICCQIGNDFEDIATIRAKSIYSFLIENGIDKSRLQYKGFGSTKPIHRIPERNEDERNENRRVEIMILENE